MCPSPTPSILVTSQFAQLWVKLPETSACRCQLDPRFHLLGVNAEEHVLWIERQERGWFWRKPQAPSRRGRTIPRSQQPRIPPACGADRVLVSSPSSAACPRGHTMCGIFPRACWPCTDAPCWGVCSGVCPSVIRLSHCSVLRALCRFWITVLYQIHVLPDYGLFFHSINSTFHKTEVCDCNEVQLTKLFFHRARFWSLI